jgi:hypothetical protein
MGAYLANIKAEIEKVKEKFSSREEEPEKVLARYLESALQDISMTLSIENKIIKLSTPNENDV